MALWFGQAMLVEGWRQDVRLTIRDGRIAGVDAGVPPRPGDERHGIALPGLPNVHSHAFQRGMAGLAEQAGPGGDSFWTWRAAMYRFVDRLDPEGLRAIAALAYVEMLESGFTRVGEFHYLHHDPAGEPYGDPAEMARAIVEAAKESGIALTLLPVFYAHAGFGGGAPEAGQRRFVNDVDGFARLVEGAREALEGLPDAVLGVAPHSLRAVTADELAAPLPLAPDGPVHIHVAEQQAEVDACLAWSGQRPVEWLLDHADVDARWCLVHATHMTDAETQAVARSGAIAGLCPVTEANLGDGLFPLRAFVEAGGRYGIGSDSNILIDCAEELRLLEYGQRLVHRARNVMAGGAGRSTGADLYEGALAGGAAALGVEAGIAPGRSADIVSLTLDHPSLARRQGDALIDSFLFAAGRSAIDCVWRHGEKLVSQGRHRIRDRAVRDYQRILERLIA